MTTGRCAHGRYPDKCYPCHEATSSTTPARGAVCGGQSKQASLSALCDLLGLPGMSIGVGSSVPSELFDALSNRFQVAPGSMPEVAEAVAGKAGLSWDEICDSRGTLSGGGSTVTLAGLQQLTRAVRLLL